MKKYMVAIAAVLTLLSSVADAKGGFRFGGGGRSFSSGSSRSFSAPSRPSAPSYSAPRPSTPAPSAAPKPSYTSPSVTPKTTTTTTQRSTSSGSYGAPVAYGGLGMGVGYSNGMLTGLLIGNMLHPHNTTVYTGPHSTGSTLLYPDGKVVNGNGQQIGTYDGSNYTPMQNGPIVAQHVPPDNSKPWYWWFGVLCLIAIALGLGFVLLRVLLH